MKIALSKFTTQDFEDYFRLVSDIKVMAMITECAIEREQAQQDYQTLLSSNTIDPDLGQFRILDAQQGKFIGLAKLELAQQTATEAELGYMLLPEYWGQGIATQVTTLLIDWAEHHSQLQSLIAIIDPANLASRKVLIKHGFLSREFKSFDGLPGEILERGC